MRLGFQLSNLNVSNLWKENIGNIQFKNILYKGLDTAIILIAMFLAIKIGSAIITKFVEKQKKMRYSLDIKKAKTLGAVLKSILRYCVYFSGIMIIFKEYFGTIGLTFAGIGGVAIGFGSQSLVKDIINGFFILFEDHFAVGDYIDVENKSGIVESLELRVTKIRDFNGDLHIIPNGLVTKVTNHSRGLSRFVVSFDIGYDENMDKVIEVMNRVCIDFREENETVVEGPSVSGVTDFKENFYTMKVSGKAKPMSQWDNENKLRMEIKRALDKEEIRIACTKIKIVKEDKDGEKL